MKDNELSDFIERFVGLAADSDYSQYPMLRAASQYDIQVAAEALWTYAARENVGLSRLDEQMMTTAMLAQDERWDDEDELVSVRYEEYWDMTDTLNFPGVLVKDIKRELTRKYLGEKKAEYIVVSNEHGIWLFLKEALCPVRNV